MNLSLEISGSKGGRRGESACLPTKWFGFKSRRRRHMWVEFVVGSLLCSERFFSGYSGFPLSSKTNISKFQFDQESKSLVLLLLFFFFFIFFFFFFFFFFLLLLLLWLLLLLLHRRTLIFMRIKLEIGIWTPIHIFPDVCIKIFPWHGDLGLLKDCVKIENCTESLSSWLQPIRFSICESFKIKR